MEQNGKASPNLAVKLFNKSQELDKELRTLLKKKNPQDKQVASIRLSIRECYEKILFTDFDLAASKEVEQNLWKTCYYKVIEDFRKRIRKHAMLVKNAQAVAGQPPKPTADELQKMCEGFRVFLAGATKFYQNLVENLRSAYNLHIDGTIDYYADPDKVHKAFLSVHRCYIFLGDLARYHRDLIGHPAQGDWTKAYQYYQQALLLVPDNGNPHNQLAVLATYADDEFAAVYHYFLSLAVAHPFLTARDNLIVLFEKNRVRLTSAEGETANKKDDHEAPTHSKRSPALKTFLTRVVRLHGIMFTKTSLEKFDEIQGLVLKDLDHLLKEEITEDMLVRMFVMNMSSIYNVSWIPEGHAPSYAEISQRSALTKSSVNLALEFFARVLRQPQPTRQRHATSIALFIDYLNVNPKFVLKPLANEDKDSSVNLNVWGAIWKDFASYLNDFGEEPAASVGHAPILKEEIELRGFVPLKDVYRELPVTLESMAANNEHTSLAKRKAKAQVFGLANLFYDREVNVFSDRPIDKSQVQTRPNGNLVEAAGERMQVSPKLPELYRPEAIKLQQQDIDEDDFDEDFDVPIVPQIESVLADDDLVPPSKHSKSNAVHTADMDDEVILFKPGEGTKVTLSDQSETNAYNASHNRATIGSGRAEPGLSLGRPERSNSGSRIEEPAKTSAPFDIFGVSNNSLFANFHSSVPQPSFSPPPISANSSPSFANAGNGMATSPFGRGFPNPGPASPTGASSFVATSQFGPNSASSAPTSNYGNQGNQYWPASNNHFDSQSFYAAMKSDTQYGSTHLPQPQQPQLQQYMHQPQYQQPQAHSNAAMQPPPGFAPMNQHQNNFGAQHGFASFANSANTPLSWLQQNASEPQNQGQQQQHQTNSSFPMHPYGFPFPQQGQPGAPFAPNSSSNAQTFPFPGNNNNQQQRLRTRNPFLNN